MQAARRGDNWENHRASNAIDPVMRFSDQGLTMGAGTVLVSSGVSCRDIRVDPADARLRALLAAAHQRAPSLGGLNHLCKAAERWREGRDSLAAMHLALSRLNRLSQPEADAHRLFLAEGLLLHGVEAGAIIKAAVAALERSQVRKYDPDQPRVPAGSGRASGQWASSGNATPGEVNPSTITEVYDPTYREPTWPYRGEHACDLAGANCGGFVLHMEDPTGGAANDNINSVGRRRCGLATDACKVLSWSVERLWGFRRAGVLFPHGGVVVMQQDQPDIYFPPKFRNTIPYFKVSE